MTWKKTAQQRFWKKYRLVREMTNVRTFVVSQDGVRELSSGGTITAEPGQPFVVDFPTDESAYMIGMAGQTRMRLERIR